MKNWIVYILKLKDGSYYTGITNNLAKRLRTHDLKKGSKYVASRLPFSVVYICHCKNRSVASKYEAKIKRMPRRKKELLMNNETKDKVNLYCEVCSTVTSISKKDMKWPKFEINCFVCKNKITYEEK